MDDLTPSRPLILTGASSFVGCRLARFLAERGFHVVGTISQPRQAYGGLLAERLAFAEQAGVELKTLDMMDTTRVERTIREIQPVYWISHAGWTRNHASADYDLDFGHLTNVAPYKDSFRALADVGCAGVISTGSCSEYFNDGTACLEDDFRWPTQPYGLSKLTKTIRCRQLAHQYGLRARVARLFTPYGILDSPERILSVAAQAFLSGKPVEASSADIQRDFVHVEDVCRMYVALLKDLEREEVFDVFNVSSGQPVTLGEAAAALAREMDADPALVRFGARPGRSGEQSTLFGSAEKARRILHWEAGPLEKGMKRFVFNLRKFQTATVGPQSRPLVRLSKSSIGPREIRRTSTTLYKGFLGMGQETAEFERELSSFLGGREVVAVANGTAALHLALQGCGLGPGDEVLVPTVTFVACFQAVTATGATPVACDIREDTLYLDVEDAARRITARTRAILPVHYAGSAAGYSEVAGLARQHGLRVIEDAAHAFGSTHQGRLIGSFGDITCFSFDGIKNITCGEGGAIVTSDAAVAQAARDSRLLGVLKDSEARYAGSRKWEFDVTRQGWRYHMSNINAAIGLAQLAHFRDGFAPRRRDLARNYSSQLAGVPGLRIPCYNLEEMVPHIFPVLVEDGTRDALREALRQENIETGIHYQPNHLLTYFGGGAVQLPVAERLFRQLLTLPLHVELTEAEQARVLEVVRAHFR